MVTPPEPRSEADAGEPDYIFTHRRGSELWGLTGDEDAERPHLEIWHNGGQVGRASSIDGAFDAFPALATVRPGDELDGTIELDGLLWADLTVYDFPGNPVSISLDGRESELDLENDLGVPGEWVAGISIDTGTYGEALYRYGPWLQQELPESDPVADWNVAEHAEMRDHVWRFLGGTMLTGLPDGTVGYVDISSEHLVVEKDGEALAEMFRDKLTDTGMISLNGVMVFDAEDPPSETP